MIAGSAFAEPNDQKSGTASQTRSAVVRCWRSPMLKPFSTTLPWADRKSTRLNSSHSQISYAVFCLKKKKTTRSHSDGSTRRAETTAENQGELHGSTPIR